MVGPGCATKAAARVLAERTLPSVIRQRKNVDSGRNVTLGEFVQRIYLPHAEGQLRASTAYAYKGQFRLYLKNRATAKMWMRDIETRHVQKLLEEVASETGVTHITLGHLKHLLSGAFRYAAQQGFLDSGRAYTLEEIFAMLKLVGWHRGHRHRHCRGLRFAHGRIAWIAVGGLRSSTGRRFTRDDSL